MANARDRQRQGWCRALHSGGQGLPAAGSGSPCLRPLWCSRQLIRPERRPPVRVILELATEGAPPDGTTYTGDVRSSLRVCGYRAHPNGPARRSRAYTMSPTRGICRQSPQVPPNPGNAQVLACNGLPHCPSAPAHLAGISESRPLSFQAFKLSSCSHQGFTAFGNSIPQMRTGSRVPSSL